MSVRCCSTRSFQSFSAPQHRFIESQDLQKIFPHLIFWWWWCRALSNMMFQNPHPPRSYSGSISMCRLTHRLSLCYQFIWSCCYFPFVPFLKFSSLFFFMSSTHVELVPNQTETAPIPPLSHLISCCFSHSLMHLSSDSKVFYKQAKTHIPTTESFWRRNFCFCFALPWGSIYLCECYDWDIRCMSGCKGLNPSSSL